MQVNIEMNASTKAILTYMKKIKEGSLAKAKIKRIKLSSDVGVVRPEAYPDIDLQQLCDTLMRAAYNVSFIDPVYLEHVEGLVVDESLQWYHILDSIVNTKLKSLYLKCQLCIMLRAMLPRVQIRSFGVRESANEIIKHLKPSFDYAVQTILEVLELDDAEIDKIMLENNDYKKLYMPPLQALSTFVHDGFCRTILILHCAQDVKQKLQLVYDAFCEPENPDTDAVGLMEMIIELLDEHIEPKPFVHNPEGLNLFDFKNPSIKIVVSIFACFKMSSTCLEIAETIRNFAEILRIPASDVIFDLIHAAYLLKCEESIDLDLLHLPKQHRVDFRWQYTAFFYRKLPGVILHLAASGKMSKEDVADGLERSFKYLTMMFDLADKSWQNASFLVLLKNLEPLLGPETTELFKSRRREHMTTSPELKSLISTEENIIQDTEVDYFFRALRDVAFLETQREPEFWTIFENLALQCQCDIFDAYTSVLYSDGKLLGAGKKFIEQNLAAQTPSFTSLEERMNQFDRSFLVMTRILMKNSNVNIKLFVNGGPGETESQNAIFFNWSMWYMKRVRNQELLTRDIDNRVEELRPKVLALVKAANRKVGLAEDFEDDEVVLENEKPQEESKDKPMDTSNAPGTSENAPEENSDVKMEEGTSEGAGNQKSENSENPENVQSTENLEEMKPESLNPSEVPPTIPEASIEVQPTIDLVPVTWQTVNCPLPRISRKVAREYLQVLKEGRPFWSQDDQHLNLGALLAAIPVIGRLLIEEHEDKKHRMDKKTTEEQASNILHGISNMTCLLVCLVEWMDCEADSHGRTSLATSIHSSLDRCILETECKQPELSMKWKFIKNTIQHILVEIIDKTPVFPEVTCTAFSTARRFCPFVYRDEVPDLLKMKHAFYYMRQQGWASPHALRLLEHANSSGDSTRWSTIYINKTTKIGCGDIMKSSGDMIFTFLMMDPLVSIIKIQEGLMEFWLNESVIDYIDNRYDPLPMGVALRLMTQVLLLAEWFLDRMINEEPRFQPKFQWTDGSEVLIPEDDDPNKREKWIYLLRSLLERTVNRFAKILRRGRLCTVVNTIIQIIKSIAGTADCHAKRLLIRRINPEMIFEIAYIEPSSVNFQLMEMFCEKGNEAHDQLKILFLCALRRANVQI